MSINVGGIDLANSVINNEMRIIVLEKIIEKLVRDSVNVSLSNSDIERFKEEAFEQLNKKYPNAGLKKQ